MSEKRKQKWFKTWWRILIIGFFIYIFIFITIPFPPALALDKITPINQNQTKISGKTFSKKPLWLLKDDKIVSYIKAGNEGKFVFEAKDLIEGENKFVVKACQKGDQKYCVKQEIVVMVDKIPPQPPTYTASLLRKTDSEKIMIHGNSEKESKVKIFINGEEKYVTKTNQDGIFETEVLLLEGENKIKAQAVDEAENQSDFSEEIIVVYAKQLQPTPKPSSSPNLKPSPTPSVLPKPTPEIVEEIDPYDVMVAIGKGVTDNSNVSVFKNKDGSIDVINNIQLTPEVNIGLGFDTYTRKWITEFLAKSYTSDLKIRYVLVTVSFLNTGRLATRVGIGINQASKYSDEEWKKFTPYDLCNWLNRIQIGDNVDPDSSAFNPSNWVFAKNYNCT